MKNKKSKAKVNDFERILKSKNIVQKENKKWKPNNSSLVSKRIYLSLVTLAAAAIPVASFFVTSSFMSKSDYVSKIPEPPAPEINYQAIADAIVDYNPSLNLSRSPLASRRPSAITSAMLNANNLGLNLSNVADVDQSLLRFQVITSSVDDFQGTLSIDLFYNNFKAKSSISLRGLTVKPILKVVLNPIPTITVNQGGTIELVVDAIIENSATTPITYGWEYLNTSTNTWLSLSESSIFSGTKTSKLVVSNIRLSDATQYRCKVSSSDVFIYSNSASIIVNVVIKPIVEQIVDLNKNITVTDPIITAKLPSTLTVGELNTTNIILNTTGITGYNSSLLSFVSLSDANDFEGTVQLKISYDGTISNIPIFLSGFAKKNQFNYISIALNTSGSTLQNTVNTLASNINSTMTRNYYDLFVVRDVITNTVIDTRTAISSISDRITLSGNKYQLSLTLGLNENYVTSSDITYSATSNSDVLLYKNQADNGNWNNFNLGTNLGNFVYVNGNIAQTLPNNTTNAYSAATLMKLVDVDFPEYTAATFVRTRSVIQDVKNPSNLFFLNEYSRDPFQHETPGVQVNFAVLYKLRFSANNAPVATKIVNLDRQYRLDPVEYSYINSSSMAMDSVNNKLYIFPPKFTGTHSNIVLVDNPTNTPTIYSANVAHANFYNHASLSNTDTIYVKSAKIVESSVDNGSGGKIQVLGLALAKENETTRNLYFSAIKLDSYNTSTKWYDITQTVSTSRTTNNYFNNINDDISFIDQTNYIANNKMLFLTATLNTRRLYSNRVVIDTTTKNMAVNTIYDSSISAIWGNTTLAVVVTNDMKMWVVLETALYLINADSNTTVSWTKISDIKSNTSIFNQEKYTELFINSSNQLVAMTSFRNKFAYDSNTGSFIQNLRPFA